VQILTGTAYTNTYATTYAKFDGYKESQVAGSSTYFQAGATTSSYDRNGNLTAVSETFATSKNRSFVTDQAGHILRKTENGKTQNYFYAGDKPLGSSGALTGADFDFNYTPVSEQFPGTVPGSYVVSAGDTLRGIALAVFGDAQLWYLIADANGLKTDADLTAGRNLTIPNKVTNLRNAADTFKPYAPGAIIGDTTPTLPDPPPPPPVYSSSGGGGGCGGFGAILVAVIAVVAVVMTAGVLAAPTVSTLAGTWSAGVGALGAGIGGAVASGAAYSTALGIGSFALAGAVGSIASQAVGMAIGVQEEFSWGAVAMGALSSVAGGAAGKIVGTSFGPAGGFGNLVARAVVGSVITQGVGVAVGLQKEFSWSGVAAAGVSAGLSSAVADSSFGKAIAANGGVVGKGLMETLTSGTAHALVFGGKVNWTNVAADAFGNAIANSLGYRATAVGNAEQGAVLDDAVRLAWDQGNERLYSEGEVPGGGDVEYELPGMGGYAAGNSGAVGMAITAKRGDPLNQSASLIYAEDFASDVKQRRQQYAAFLGTAGSRDGGAVGSGDDPLVGIGLTQNDLNAISDGLATRAQIGGPINPQAENLYRPAESVLGNLYRDSYRNAFDTSRPLFERVGYGAGAIAAALPGLANDIAVGTYNSVDNLWTGAQEMAFGIHAGDPYRFAGGLGRTSDGLLNFAGVAAMIPSGGAVGVVANRTALSADEFLSANRIADPVLRQRIIDSGLRTDLLDPVLTRDTLTRFDKLFPQTIEKGSSFSGRLGNIDTRVATINEAAQLERAGLSPAFEYPVNIGGGRKRFVDLVGLDVNTGQPVKFVQFVKKDANGVLLRPDEIVAAQQIERAYSLTPGTVRLVNTRR
jgi:hypothetical protein